MCWWHGQRKCMSNIGWKRCTGIWRWNRPGQRRSACRRHLLRRSTRSSLSEGEFFVSRLCLTYALTQIRS